MNCRASCQQPSLGQREKDFIVFLKKLIEKCETLLFPKTDQAIVQFLTPRQQVFTFYLYLVAQEMENKLGILVSMIETENMKLGHIRRDLEHGITLAEARSRVRWELSEALPSNTLTSELSDWLREELGKLPVVSI